jgi:hypothetical protein
LSGRKVISDRLRPNWWETTLPVRDADKRARLLVLQCEEEALEDRFLEFAAHLGVLHGETMTGEPLLNVFREHMGEPSGIGADRID